MKSSTSCDRALAVAKRSKCPSRHWKDAITAPLLLVARAGHPGVPLTYVNAGANKGFGVAEFLQRYHDDGGRAPSNREWRRGAEFETYRCVAHLGTGLRGAETKVREGTEGTGMRRRLAVCSRFIYS